MTKGACRMEPLRGSIQHMPRPGGCGAAWHTWGWQCLGGAVWCCPIKHVTCCCQALHMPGWGVLPFQKRGIGSISQMSFISQPLLLQEGRMSP